MPTLSFDTYGKTRVRLLQLLHGDPSDNVVEITVTILFEGRLAESYTAGDNALVLPTDTMKNTVYALARQHPIDSIERFALHLGRHFLERLPHLSAVHVEIAQTPWTHIGTHAGAFTQSGKDQRTARVAMTRGHHTIESGLRNLQILKTRQSAFFGFLKDEYTTLPEAHDRLFGTVLDADWTLSPSHEDLPFNELHSGIRGVLLDKFAAHDSLSVQHTLYAMAEAALAAFDQVQEIHLTMPNKHCLLVDLSRFGLDNPNQVFVPTDEPSGFIEARISR